MQLSKPFNFEQNSIFTDHIIRDDHFSHSSQSPRHSQGRTVNRINNEDARNIQNGAKELRFFQEYKKIYNVAYHLYIEKQRLIEMHKQIAKQINSLEDRIRNKEEREAKKTENSSQENKIKRSRRTAEMIEKKFKCNVAFCERLYGSEGSLQQHIKLKHPQLYRGPDNASQLFSEDFNDSL